MGLRRGRQLVDEARLEQRDEGPELALGRRARVIGVGVAVPAAREAREVDAAAVAVGGEHRADAAADRVGVGADDDRVVGDAAEHRLAACARHRLDRRPQPQAGVPRSPVATPEHRSAEDGAIGAVRQGVPLRRAGKGLQRAMRAIVARLRRRRARVPGDRARAGPARARGHEVDGPDLGALARAGRGARACASPPRRSTRSFRLPPPGEEAGAGEAALAMMPLLEDFRPGRPRQRHPDPGAVARRRAARRAAGDADPPPLPRPRARDAVLRDGDGAAADRRSAGGMWRAALPVLETGLRIGRRELNETRRRIGLPPQERFHGGISDRLVIVGTFPQLEYPRAWPAEVGRHRAARVRAPAPRRRAAARATSRSCSSPPAPPRIPTAT